MHLSHLAASQTSPHFSSLKELMFASTKYGFESASWLIRETAPKYTTPHYLGDEDEPPRNF